MKVKKKKEKKNKGVWGGKKNERSEKKIVGYEGEEREGG